MQLDAFDTLVQRQLQRLPQDFAKFTRDMPRCESCGDAADGEEVVLVGEHNCWPWPQPEVEKTMGNRRPRGVSMGYMRNSTFSILIGEDRRKSGTSGAGSGWGGIANGSRTVRGDGVCAALRERTKTGRWQFPNSGAYVTTLRGGRALLERLRRLVLDGHFEDQGMVGLALLQHPGRSLVVDASATLLSSQYGYNANWWARPACFDGYFDANGEPPVQLTSGDAPFAMHFNGPAGRYRLGWCVAAFLRRCQRPHQFYVDLDAGGVHVPLPSYCDGDSVGDEAGSSAASQYVRRQTSAKAPPGHTPVLPSAACVTATQPRVRCTNDRCLTFMEH